MEPERSLPLSQELATYPYPEPDQSSPCPPFHFLKIHLNIILPAILGSFKWSLTSRFPNHNPVYNSPIPIRATCPAYLILLDLITWRVFGEEYRSLSSSLRSFFHSLATSSLSDPNILLSTLFLNTLTLRFFLSVSDQVSHPYKTTSKIIILCILIFKFLYNKPEDKRFYIEWYQAFPDFNLLLISSWIEFWFVRFASTYLDCPTLLYDLLSIFILWFVLHSDLETWPCT